MRFLKEKKKREKEESAPSMSRALSCHRGGRLACLNGRLRGLALHGEDWKGRVLRREREEAAGTSGGPPPARWPHRPGERDARQDKHRFGPAGRCTEPGARTPGRVTAESTGCVLRPESPQSRSFIRPAAACGVTCVAGPAVSKGEPARSPQPCPWPGPSESSRELRRLAGRARRAGEASASHPGTRVINGTWPPSRAPNGLLPAARGALVC